MGNTLSSWGGQKRVASIIDKAGLPLQIDSSGEGDNKRELSRFTRAYDAPGWFTGVRSTVTVPATPEVVYQSLSKDLQNVFTPMSECDDEIREENGNGEQKIFRIVRIPFKVAFVTGNLKLRLNVTNNPAKNHILFESAQEGRLITQFIADFEIKQLEGDEVNSVVELNAKINAKSLPPPPFKNMVKDVMVSKMDSCMVDLVDFHTRALQQIQTEQAEQETKAEKVEEEVPQSTAVESDEEFQTPSSTLESPEMERAPSQGFDFSARRQQQDTGFLAVLRRSFGAGLPQRRSFEHRRSMEKQRQRKQQSRRSIEKQCTQRIASASTLHGAASLEAPKPDIPLAPRPETSPRPNLSMSQADVFARWQASHSLVSTQ